MSVVSQFYGILIRMFYNDYVPPHFHAVYGEYELIVCISPIAILEGKAPNRVRSMVLEWTALHQQELSENCRQGEPPLPIEPLE
ncbi:DUF4160 domain-containing protein [Microseira wollei]|uniref:Transcriptional regulator n=1 Tax=Microseira wollei NIES-4236 TaxID=2530354 RepID=A0AAV3X6Q3_9CYAN|nr:DUF4160 domain-containing protein [Microseira wollei]GET36981.1 hypothetical protein MiSe_17340 [Microseira wollei NIES-4236]